MQVQTIIVPIDFSESGEAALQLATSLARDSGASLHIIHAKERLIMYHLDPNTATFLLIRIWTRCDRFWKRSSPLIPT